jgi:hypothetical protein
MSIGSQRAAVLLAGCVLLLPLAACDNIDAPTDPISGAPMLYPEGQNDGTGSASYALEQTGGCQDVETTLRSVFINEMIGTLQSSFASALESKESCRPSWLFSGGADMASASPKSPAPENTTSPAHSETNNQVAGVDEPDLVKTDGNYLYQVSNGALRIIRSWPAAETAKVAKVELEGTPKKLFVLGDRVLIYSSLDGGSSANGSGYYSGASSECTYGYDCVPTGDGHPTKITILDVTDRSAPKVLRELKLSSSLLAARRIGSTVHTVVTTSMKPLSYSSWPSDLRVCDSSRVSIYNAFRALLLSNLEQLRGVKLDAQLPTLEDRVHGEAGVVDNESPLGGCHGFLRSSLADGSQITSLVSIAIDDEKPAQAVSIVSRPGVVYSSESALFVAEPHTRSYCGWYASFNDSSATTVHKFDLTGPAPTYAASGLVKGRLLNQLALDEKDGFLRVASTSGHVSKGEASSTNRLVILEQQGVELRQAGSVEDIAVGEDIRSVHFDGDRGYIVTFKKTDPLFVLDLADPRNPRLLGELQIPGFSTYMHRLDAGHLLTIGYDASDQGSFAWFTGVMLQIFDVSNPTQPKLAFKHAIATRGSSSEALTNHLAFTYYAPKNLLALPMTVCDGGNGSGYYGEQMTFSGLMLFGVTLEQGFDLRGKVDFPPGQDVSCGNWWTNGSSAVKRSVVIENFVYSLSDDLLKVRDLAAPQAELVSVALD